MRPLTDDEIARIKASFHGPNALRNRSLFEVGRNCGFRVSEMLSLDIGGVLDDGGNLRPCLTVARKSMKGRQASRSIVVNASCRAAIMAYVRQRQELGTLHYSFPLFLTSRLQRMTREAAWNAMTQAYVVAGLGSRGIGMHGLRKTFAMRVHAHFVRRGQELNQSPIDAIRYTKEALGHKTLDSTLCYLGFDQAMVDQAILDIGLL
jgi:site-specific recombinase XerD